MNYFGILAFQMTRILQMEKLFFNETEVFTVVEVQIVIFWFVASCDHVGGYQCYEGTCYPHIQDKSGVSRLL
jgi:hypothetical protein